MLMGAGLQHGASKVTSDGNGNKHTNEKQDVSVL